MIILILIILHHTHLNTPFRRATWNCMPRNATPLKIHMEARNHPIANENHCSRCFLYKVKGRNGWNQSCQESTSKLWNNQCQDLLDKKIPVTKESQERGFELVWELSIGAVKPMFQVFEGFFENWNCILFFWNCNNCAVSWKIWSHKWRFGSDEFPFQTGDFQVPYQFYQFSRVFFSRERALVQREKENHHLQKYRLVKDMGQFPEGMIHKNHNFLSQRCDQKVSCIYFIIIQQYI